MKGEQTIISLSVVIWVRPGQILKRQILQLPIFVLALLFIYDSRAEKNIVVVGTDRRREDAKLSMVWIYNNSLNDIFSQPLNYQLYKTFNRPQPNEYFFYGYPCVTKMKNGNYLVIFTESHIDELNEAADFFQFELSFR